MDWIYEVSASSVSSSVRFCAAIRPEDAMEVIERKDARDYNYCNFSKSLIIASSGAWVASPFDGCASPKAEHGFFSASKKRLFVVAVI